MTGIFGFGDTGSDAVLTALGKSQAWIEFKPSGEILTANNNLLTVMGYSLDQIKGQHHRMFMHDDDAASPDYEKFWRELASGQFKANAFRRKTRSGDTVWLRATYNPVVDKQGKVVKVVKVAIDITDQYADINRANSLYAAVNEAMAMIEFDLDGTIRHANKNFLAAMGYQLSEVAGRHHSIFVDPDYARSEDYREFWRVLNNGLFQTGEFERIGKSGDRVWINASYFPIRDHKGELIGVAKIATDVTEHVTARAEAARTQSALQESFLSVVDELRVAHDQSSNVAAGSGEMSNTIQAVAAAAEEFTSSIAEISQSMARSTSAVETAVGAVGATDQATQALVTSAEQMNSIISMIDDIAGQINLLALNATIESARAGEAGKGFAVVAVEVKNLAGQVASATSQISEEIAGMQSISGDVVERLGQIRQAVSTVEENVSAVASAVEEQSAMTGEIAQNTRLAADAADRTNTGVGNVANSMESANQHAQHALNIISEAS